MNTRLAVLALATAALAACEPNPSVTGPAAALQAARDAGASAALADPGAVYTLTNQVGGNAVAVFARGADGRLTAAGTVSTGGTGTGAGLGSQGAVALSDDGRWLFAVNAGSNDVSVFAVRPSGVSLAGRTASGGTRPISLTIHRNVLYVLNAGGDGNISGFTVSASGDLTPFGFAFGHRNELFVSEASGSASSYLLGRRGGLRTVSGAVLTHQGAPCWLVVTDDGRYTYTANAQGASISGFTIARNGAI